MSESSDSHDLDDKSEKAAESDVANIQIGVGDSESEKSETSSDFDEDGENSNKRNNSKLGVLPTDLDLEECALLREIAQEARECFRTMPVHELNPRPLKSKLNNLKNVIFHDFFRNISPSS